jgi:CDP-glycerol glycerophosphotransferase (TagB/SpsB family)
MKFDACIAADFIWGCLPRGTPRIQMFHGVAGKYAHVYDRPVSSARAWHRLFFINRRRLRNFIATGAIDAESPAARLVGMPKLDCLVNGSLQRHRVLETLRIDPSRTTVLYAPTWSPYSSLNAMGETVVSRLTEAGYAVMVKLHDRSRDPEYIHSGGVDWRGRLHRLLNRTGGQLVEGADSSPYLIAADILVTDHSSIGFEYLLVDRPLIRIEMPDLIARTNVNPEYVELLASASTNIRSADQLQRAVESSLRQPSRQSQVRKAVAEELFYQAGTATHRAVQNLYEVLELDPPGDDRSALRPSY